MRETVKFSIIIVNFNGWLYLKECIGSILINNFEDYEIIVVDNGSNDKSVKNLKERFSPYLNKIKIVSLRENFGPARARNEGVKVSSGRYLAFLDNDTKVHPDWINEALKCFRKDKNIGAVQCKLLDFDKRRLDYTGEHLGNLGFLVPVSQYGENDQGQHDFNYEILAAKSAGMFIRRDVFEKVGGFDEDYFIFLEETDLGWRVWLSGYKIIFCPNSIVYHYFSGTKNIVDKKFNNCLIRFHGTKNYILTLFKNLSPKYLIKILPIHIFLWFCLSFYLCFTGSFNSTINIWKGIFWNMVNFRKNIRKRRLIQKKRLITDERLFTNYGLMKNRNLVYYLERFLRSQKEVITPENQ